MQTVTKTTTAAETMKRNKLSLREFDIYTITLNMFKTLNYSKLILNCSRIFSIPLQSTKSS